MPWMTDAGHALATMMLNVINGARAFTFQNYTEVNVKTGAQRVASAILTVNAGAQNYIGFRTGALPVVIKSRLINQVGSTRIDYSAQANRGFTGGTVIPISNPNNITQQPILMQAWHTVTPAAATGATVMYLQPFPILSAGVNAASRIGADTSGLEYVLAPNTDHVFTIDNVGTGNATVHWCRHSSKGIPTYHEHDDTYRIPHRVTGV